MHATKGTKTNQKTVFFKRGQRISRERQELKQTTKMNWTRKKNKWTGKQKLLKYGKNLISKQREKLRQEIREGKVISLSSIPLTNSETNLLSKGLKFCPKPKINKEEILEDLEEFVRKITWKEHFTPEDIDSDYEEEPYHTTTLDKLNDEKR